MDKHLFYELVTRYLDGTATDNEKLLVESYYDQLSSAADPLPHEKLQLLKEQLYRDIESAIHPRTKVISLQRKWWKPVAAAVVVMAVAFAAWQLWLGKDTTAQRDVATQNLYKNDISPAKGGAILTLGDGSQLGIDSIANGRLVTTDKTNIVKKEGQLLYNASAAVSYNTLTTEKGKSYQLTLADGTKVWLDAMSSIRFPTAFPGAERVVEITGQAYFEVAASYSGTIKKRFIVKAGEQIIEVLGTHFNINAYTDEEVIKTTLLEGKIKLSVTQQQTTNNKLQTILLPGQQAHLTTNHQLQIINEADVEEVMAWKNGHFRFTGNTVEEIFTHLSRWYNIEVVYEDRIPEVFVANISRDVPLSKVLALFEMTQQVQFKIEGKKVTVMRK